jgi:hypothetical protein
MKDLAKRQKPDKRHDQYTTIADPDFSIMRDNRTIEIEDVSAGNGRAH